MAVSRRGAMATPFHTMSIFADAALRRAAGLPVYDLSAGQPSTPAPAAVRAAAAHALTTDRIGYTAQLGLPHLREAIALHYRDQYGLDVPASSVAAVTGSSGGFVAAFLAAFDHGARVAVTRPGYPSYRNTLAALGCTVVDLTVDASTGYQPTVAMLEALDPPPDGLVLASPANPTGSMLAPAQFEALLAWCAAAGVRVVSDEIYHGITFGTPAACAWSYDRGAIVVNSFSKYYAMTGWRLGWLLAPDELMPAVDALLSNLALCPPTLSQLAAVEAFGARGELDANVARYRVNRDLLLAGLPAAGLSRLSPAGGAFYVYADVGHLTDDSLVFARTLLADTGVAVAPGIDFDPVDGHRFVRLSFAGATDEVAAAVHVLGRYLA